ncbi:MAG TPA: M20 family metallopeptidase [Sedimentisphaerales bacterium]|nr:M20 family metallopeptidase [Sedimentisphaerales bacterium]
MKDLLRQLIQADSTPNKGEALAAEVLVTYFNRHGIDCHVDQWDGNRANVVAHVKTGRQRPALLFVCHLDVVSPGEEDWLHPPFAAVEDGARIYGRGTTDMKGGTAAAAAAICEMARSKAGLLGDVIFAATAGEETDSSGVVRFMQNRHALPPLAGIIVPEPTDFAVVTAHRGLFWLKIATRGKAVHSSMPERGVNAIGAMKRVLDELERYEVQAEPHPLLGNCSVSINMIAGGEAMNIVPDRCTLGVDIRTLPGQDHEAIRYDFERMLARLKTTVPQFDGELAIDRSAAAIETDPECDFVKTFCSAVDVDLTNAIGYTTDAPHLLPLGAPIVIYGPGKPRMCHQVDEYLEVADLLASVERFKKVIGRFLT